MENHNQVSFMPWANFKQVTLGNVIFWAYDPHQVTDVVIREHLNKLFECYVDVTGETVKPVVIASLSDKNNFGQLTLEQQLEVKEARDVLCFISIAAQTQTSVHMNNNSVVPPSAEVFQMVYQNFVPGLYDIAFRAGNTLSGGWTLDDVHFSKPLSIGGPFYGRDSQLFTGLSEILKLDAQDLRKVKLLRAIEWFRLAHVENDEVSISSRIVMMSTAFEVLLTFPKSAKSEFFQESIDKKLPSATFKSEDRPYKKGTKHASLAGWWAWDFYKLRNSIVHGDYIDPQSLVYTNWLTHLIVADLILLKLIKVELEGLGFIKDVDSFDNIYTNLGWK